MSTIYNSINNGLFRRISPDARRILDVGCDTGLMGKALKERNPDCYVAGIEVNSETAKVARSNLDEVFVMDIEKDDLSILGDQFDAILFGDVLEHLYDPEACLRRIRGLLSSRGKVYSCIPNIQFHSVFLSLLRGDFQYQKMGLMDRTHIRFYTLANIMKMFLDGGFMPKKTGRLTDKPNPFTESLGEVIKKFGFSELNIENLHTFQYFFEASPMLPIEDSGEAPPMTFVVCSNDASVLTTNLKASPLFQVGKHQLIVKKNVASAAEGYNAGFAEAKNDIIVFAHQDVYLPSGWDRRLAQQIESIETKNVSSWVYGCFGFSPSDSGMRIPKGVVIDRDSSLVNMSTTEPAEIQTLDELLVVLPKSSTARFDPALGFHLYASDICMQNSAQGGKNFAGYTPCIHNSQLYKSNIPEVFKISAKYFANKWRDTPVIVTSCKKFVSS